ncbi:MAG TPA: insulinase family protein, partial [Bacteroidales bacterium]|nr:insulinase family protein [Bacteroidales bacterium]
MKNFRKQGAAIHDFEAGVLNRAISATLECGIPVYLIKNNAIDITQIDFIFDAGAQFQQKKLIPHHCLPMLREGSQHYRASEIASILEHHAVYTESLMNRKTAGMGFYVQRKFTKQVLPVIADFLFEATFPQHELDIFNKNMHQRMQIENEKVKVLAAKRMATKMYGNTHPLGIEITPDDVLQVAAHDLQEFHRKHYHTHNCFMVLSGYYDDNLLVELNQLLSPHCKTGHSKPDAVEALPEPQPDTALEYIQKPGATQAAIRMGKIIAIDNIDEYHHL